LTEVSKKSGRKERFSEEKLRKSISAAADESGIPDKKKKEVTDKVFKAAKSMAKSKKEIETETIKEFVLKQLDAMEPAVARAWRRFEQQKREEELDEPEEEMD